MQMVKRVFLIAVLVWGAFILFAPKRELYYLLEQRLQKEGIVLSQERIRETPLGLQIKEAKLYYKGIQLGTVNEAAFWTLLFFTEIDVEGFRSSPGLRKVLDLQLSKARFRHSLLHPMTLAIDAEGNFGLVSGTMDLRTRQLRLRWLRTGEMKGLLPYLKRNGKEWYYEQKF